jgi:Oxidoreductase molybdopterin binding domain
MDDDRLTDLGPGGGGAYDAVLPDHWLAGRTRGGDARPRCGLPRSLLPRSLSPIAKPLPADRFRVHGSNAEMRWEVMRGQGLVVPSTDFFVRNHTSTPLIDAGTWSLSVFGTGLRGSVPPGRPVRFSYQDLLDLPARTVVCAIECAGNGRSFFTAQQRQPVPGTPWRLGAIGVAAWRGVPLSVGLLLEHPGLPVVRAGSPARRGLHHRPAGQERLRTRLERAAAREPGAPAHGAVLVG